MALESVLPNDLHQVEEDNERLSIFLPLSRKRHTNRNYYNPCRMAIIFHFLSHFCPFVSDFLAVFEQRLPEQLIASLPVWPRLLSQPPHSTSLSQYHVTRFGGHSLALICSLIEAKFFSEKGKFH